MKIALLGMTLQSDALVDATQKACPCNTSETLHYHIQQAVQVERPIPMRSKGWTMLQKSRIKLELEGVP